MTDTELTRPYPLTVRPHHRETVESYLDRLLDANFDTTYHRNLLDRLARVEYPALKAPERWEMIVEHKAGTPLPLLTNPARPLNHRDGSTCDACTAGIAEQYLCTQCAHGATVGQHPHLDGHVCLTHRRWVGPGAKAHDQIAVDHTIIAAERKFRKLRSLGLLDATFYMLLKSLLFGKDSPAVNPQEYVRLVDLAIALTSQEFGEVFFNPSVSYVSRFAYLQGTLENSLGRSAVEEAAELWLRFRPTVATVLECIKQQEKFIPIGPHDLPVRASVARRHWSTARSSEPFSDYLRALPTGTKTIHGGKDLSRVHLHMESNSSARGSIATICAEGHRCSWVYKNGDTTCPVCTNRLIVIGINNLSFLFPAIASEWDSQKNYNREVETVAAGSNFPAWWRCPIGHSYRKTVDERTLGGGCSYCPRPFDPARSISKLRPDLAREFDLAANGGLAPDMVTVGSHKKVTWKCAAGHRYDQIVERRTAGRYGCPLCSGHRFERGTNDFGTLFPKLAEEWDYAANAILEPSDRISRSRPVAWKCLANGHKYSQTIMHRIQSKGCPLCDAAERIETCVNES